MANLHDQIKRYADEYSRYDALRTKALENLRRVLGDSPPKGNPKRATIRHAHLTGQSIEEAVMPARPPRVGTKAAKVMEMLRRPVTIAQIQEAFKWGENTVRGFLSTAPKRFGAAIDSEKNADGKRVYFIRKP